MPRVGSETATFYQVFKRKSAISYARKDVAVAVTHSIFCGYLDTIVSFVNKETLNLIHENGSELTHNASPFSKRTYVVVETWKIKQFKTSKNWEWKRRGKKHLEEKLDTLSVISMASRHPCTQSRRCTTRGFQICLGGMENCKNVLTKCTSSNAVRW